MDASRTPARVGGKDKRLQVSPAVRWGRTGPPLGVDPDLGSQAPAQAMPRSVDTHKIKSEEVNLHPEATH